MIDTRIVIETFFVEMEHFHVITFFETKEQV
jgi:hypothetical protein